MKLSISDLQHDDNGDPNPLLKAKLPISIFNHPFTSTFLAPTNSFSDLSLSLSTNFPTGPSLKFSYTPSATATATNGVASPLLFSLSLKSGLGLSGSPRNSPLVFSANLSFSSTSPNVIIPTFSLHFKPQVGHFSLHKRSEPSSNRKTDAKCWTHSVTGSNLEPGSPSNSEFGTGFASDGSSGWQEVKLEPFTVKEKEKERFAKANQNDMHGVYSHDSGIGFGQHSRLMRGREKGGILSGFAVRARTALPLSKRLMVSLRWAVNLPGDFGVKMPYLTINKIGIEKVEVAKVTNDKKNDNNGENLDLLKGMCFWMARDLEIMEKENRDMKQCLEDLKLGVRSSPGASSRVVKSLVPASSYKLEEFEQRRNKKNDGGNGKTEVMKQANLVNDLESELQRAIKAAAS